MNKVVCAVVAVLLLSGGGLQASEALKAIVPSYMEIHSHLFRDRTDGIKQAAAAIEEQASRMGASGAAIASAAKAMQAAADLPSARAAFGPLSDAVIAAGNAEGWKDMPDVKEAYCPMIKKSWLQKDAGIRNPYYGPAMSTCGEFKRQ